MTLANTPQKITYNCNGSTVTFAVPFIFWEDASLYVYVYDEIGLARTELVLTTDYTVTGGDGATGSITTVATWSADYTITILREVDQTQLTALPASGAFPSTSVEESLDRQVAMIQDLQEQVDRSFKLPADSTLDTEVLSLSANRLLAQKTVSGATSVIFTGLPYADYDSFEVEFVNLTAGAAVTFTTADGAGNHLGRITDYTGADVVPVYTTASSWTLCPAALFSSTMVIVRTAITVQWSMVFCNIGGAAYVQMFAAGARIGTDLSTLTFASSASGITGLIRVWGRPTY